jgi:hypothetical protein
VVSVLIAVVGNNGDVCVDGMYRNIRIFHREAASGPWRLKVWFNDRVADLPTTEA